MTASLTKSKERFDSIQLTAVGMAGFDFAAVVRHIAHDPQFLRTCEEDQSYRDSRSGPHLHVLRIIESVVQAPESTLQDGEAHGAWGFDTENMPAHKIALLSLIPTTLTHSDRLVDPQATHHFFADERVQLFESHHSSASSAQDGTEGHHFRESGGASYGTSGSSSLHQSVPVPKSGPRSTSYDESTDRQNRHEQASGPASHAYGNQSSHQTSDLHLAVSSKPSWSMDPSSDSVGTPEHFGISPISGEIAANASVSNFQAGPGLNVYAAANNGSSVSPPVLENVAPSNFVAVQLLDAGTTLASALSMPALVISSAPMSADGATNLQLGGAVISAVSDQSLLLPGMQTAVAAANGGDLLFVGVQAGLSSPVFIDQHAAGQLGSQRQADVSASVGAVLVSGPTDASTPQHAEGGDGGTAAPHPVDPTAATTAPDPSAAAGSTPTAAGPATGLPAGPTDASTPQHAEGGDGGTAAPHPVDPTAATTAPDPSAAAGSTPTAAGPATGLPAGPTDASTPQHAEGGDGGTAAPHPGDPTAATTAPDPSAAAGSTPTAAGPATGLPAGPTDASTPQHAEGGDGGTAAPHPGDPTAATTAPDPSAAAGSTPTAAGPATGLPAGPTDASTPQHAEGGDGGTAAPHPVDPTAATTAPDPSAAAGSTPTAAGPATGLPAGPTDASTPQHAEGGDGGTAAPHPGDPTAATTAPDPSAAAGSTPTAAGPATGLPAGPTDASTPQHADGGSRITSEKISSSDAVANDPHSAVQTDHLVTEPAQPKQSTASSLSNAEASTPQSVTYVPNKSAYLEARASAHPQQPDIAAKVSGDSQQNGHASLTNSDRHDSAPFQPHAYIDIVDHKDVHSGHADGAFGTDGGPAHHSPLDPFH